MGQERLVHACKNKTKQNINTAMLYQTVGFQFSVKTPKKQKKTFNIDNYMFGMFTVTNHML